MAKRLFITGVSSGIGLGLAQYALAQGYAVDAMNRSAPKALMGKPDFSFQALDLSALDTIGETVKNFVPQGARYDVVVLNAGVLSAIEDLAKTSLEDIFRVMDINVWANKVLIDALLSRAQVRQLVAISSGAAVSGSRGWNAYALSKATLNAMIKLYAAEQPEVHFSALAPGLVDTTMQDYLCGLPEDARFPKMDALKSARGTPDMPDAQTLAPRLVEVFDTLYQEHPSGAFVDIRKL